MLPANLIIIIIGTICTGLWGFVTWMSLGLPDDIVQRIDQYTFHLASFEIQKLKNGFYYDIYNAEMPTVVFLVIFVIVFLIVFWLMTYLEKAQTNKFTVLFIFCFAVIFRIVLLPSILIHENDIYRYLWDGKTINKGINPYKYAPADLYMYEQGYQSDYYDEYHEVFLKAKPFSHEDHKRLAVLIRQRDVNAALYDRIGHWEVPTIYPPVAEAVFFLSTLIKPDSIFFMKFIFMLFDIGAILLIIGIFNQLKLDPSLSIVYAWSPLVLKEFPNSGHYDPVMIFFTTLAIYLLIKGRELGAYVSLALATLTKFFSGILLPFFLRMSRKRWIIVFFLIPVAAYYPFIVWNDTQMTGVFEGLQTYNKIWSYNASVYAVVYCLLDHFAAHTTNTLFWPKAVSGFIFLLVWIILIFKKDNSKIGLLRKCFWATATLFIINPVGDPWYYCWIMPYLCFFRYRSWILLSALLALSYLNFHSEFSFLDIKYFQIPILNYIIYVPFFLCFFFEISRKPEYIEQ